MNELNDYTEEIIRQKLFDAIKTLFNKDNDLIKKGVHEQAITHRLAMYLEMQFSEWEHHIDCEYDKSRDKRKTNNDGEHFRPDIIIHKRGENRYNLLCIEMKKETESDKQDQEKLRSVLGKDTEYNYKYGVYLNIHKNGYNGTIMYMYANARIEADFEMEKKTGESNAYHL